MNVEINVRKNDRVIVIAGKDKGKKGRVKRGPVTVSLSGGLGSPP